MVWTAEKILKSDKKEIIENLDKIKNYLKIKEKYAKINTLDRIVFNKVLNYLVSKGIDVTELIE